MPRSERDEVISKLTTMMFSAMISDLVMDATLQAHYEVQKLSVLCDVCHTRCGTAHATGSNESANPTASRPPSPSIEGKQSTPTGSVSGASTGPTNGKSDSVVYFECLGCKRQIASNRYAPHLSSCVGMGIGNRRGGSRNPITKSKSGGDQGRSESPYLGSEGSDDSKPSTKSKGKGKAAKKDDGDYSSHRKRAGSPQATPKKTKKAKTGGSPLKHITDMPPPASRKFSKLRGSSITRESSNAPSVGDESRMSVFSPEGTPVSPTSSADSPPATSVQVTDGTHTQKSGVTNSIPAKSATPSQSNVHDPSYMMMEYDDNETGSSTDSDSD
ncbi:hypothetical protein BJ322DRAFT_756492 [Thelephora terrestris]|uniref:SAGA-associated factor 11 n=1 Tax=Thelephora terrestris TaxID=56493 RepID=A0A9P6HFP0_9AGAM|nr:hypothetical protein BJ322DRAFT_756492 [Thelephora terrestris]